MLAHANVRDRRTVNHTHHGLIGSAGEFWMLAVSERGWGLGGQGETPFLDLVVRASCSAPRRAGGPAGRVLGGLSWADASSRSEVPTDAVYAAKPEVDLKETETVQVSFPWQRV